MGTTQLGKLHGVLAGTKLLQEHVPCIRLLYLFSFFFHVLWEMKQHPCNMFLCNEHLKCLFDQSTLCTALGCHSDFSMWPFESKYVNKRTGLILSEVIAPTSPLSKDDCTKCHRNNSLKSATVIEGFWNSKYRVRTEKQRKEEKSAFN